ncbi:MAG: glycerol-3-phosphate acyltransferase [Dehalococcoidales bacterium]|nr:glycerol-3-phosphate acyltransferase [Dehalococcoidales bacterium]
MEILLSLLLASAAFLLGACPFSVWIGQKLLHEDITSYGDGNPGAANVFRAGSIPLGLTAVILDVVKGVPFVLLADSFFNFPYAIVMMIGMCAILGHAFSPFLNLRGGKAIAITFGVLIAIPQHDLLVIYIIFTVLGFLFVEQHSWVAMMGPIGSSVYLLINSGISEEFLFILFLLVLFTIKQNRELRSFPVFGINIIKWSQLHKEKPQAKKQDL